MSLVKPRPNHYDTLGIAPSASADEISDAFARKMSLFQADPLGRSAQICIAYETLRDPAKRRKHDRSIGLGPEPKIELPRWTYAAKQPRWAPLVASAEQNFARRRAKAMEKAPEPLLTDRSLSEAAVDPRLAAIAASVRELAKPAVPRSPTQPMRQRPQPRPTEMRGDFSLEEISKHIRSVGRADKVSSHSSKHSGLEWKRPALTLGALIVGAGLFGALAGLSLKGDETPAPVEAAIAHGHQLTVRDHQAASSFTASAAAPVDNFPEPRAARSASASRAERTINRQRRTSLFEQRMVKSLSTPDPTAEAQPDNLGVDQPVAQADQPMTSNLPLSRALIARTIERIGYPCGAIASATEADGQAPGVFQVTCTSGHSYRATPERGRYHFRRVNS